MAQNSRNNDFHVFAQILGATIFPPNLNLGLLFAPNKLWGCILGGHVTGVGKFAKNKRTFPTCREPECIRSAFRLFVPSLGVEAADGAMSPLRARASAADELAGQL